MDPEFWRARWQENRIGFHEGAPNALLVGHFAALGVKPGGRVFVPLCGKSQDMVWLRAQGFTVVGAELSPLAVTQFFAELGMVPEVTPAGPLVRYAAEGVTIFVGDIFALDADTLGPVDAVYDRAALVALPPELRVRYAAHLCALTGAAPQLLVTFEYDQAQHAGPPFAVLEADVRAYYTAAYTLVKARSREVAGGLKGQCPAQESVWRLERPC